MIRPAHCGILDHLIDDGAIVSLDGASITIEGAYHALGLNYNHPCDSRLFAECYPCPVGSVLDYYGHVELRSRHTGRRFIRTPEGRILLTDDFADLTRQQRRAIIARIARKGGVA